METGHRERDGASAASGVLLAAVRRRQIAAISARSVVEGRASPAPLHWRKIGVLPYGASSKHNWGQYRPNDGPTFTPSAPPCTIAVGSDCGVALPPRCCWDLVYTPWLQHSRFIFCFSASGAPACTSLLYLQPARRPQRPLQPRRLHPRRLVCHATEDSRARIALARHGCTVRCVLGAAVGAAGACGQGLLLLQCAVQHASTRPCSSVPSTTPGCKPVSPRRAWPLTLG